MSNIYLRINGVGNAWPVLIGQQHPFYKKPDPLNIGNISFSLIKAQRIPFTTDNIEWEVLIDAGLSSVFQLLKNENRIPECILLSHSHQDHIGGLEWIVQSNYKLKDKKKFPIYTNPLCFNQLLLYYPYLKNITELKAADPGITLKVDEANDLTVTFFPVYHSKQAPGSSMILIEIKDKRIIYTGDLLCPLIRKKIQRNFYMLNI